MALRQIIVDKDNVSTIVESMHPSKKLFIELQRVSFLKDQLHNIIQEETLNDKNGALLIALSDVPDDRQESVMNEFIKALKSCDQEHVANIFRQESYKVPMSKKTRDMLAMKTHELCQYLDVESGCFLEKMISLGAITPDDRDRIRIKVGFDGKVRELINIIVRKADDAFPALIESLIETGQSHVVRVLSEHLANIYQADKIPMSEEHRSMIVKQAAKVCEFLDPENGVINKLRSLEVIAIIDVDRIHSKVGLDGMATELLSIIPRKSDDAFHALIDSLTETGQSHVVFLLTGEGDRRPLSDGDRKKLREKRDIVVPSIYHRDLMRPLISKGVFTPSDQQRVEGRRTRSKKAEMMMDLIIRKSQPDFDHFIEILQQNSHEHVANELMGPEVEGGKIELKLRKEYQDIDKESLEDEIREDIQRTLADDENEVNQVLGEHDISVTRVCKGSIKIEFRCKDQAALTALQQLYSSKKLDQLFNKAFCAKFADKGLESLRLALPESEFQRNFELKLMTDDHRSALMSLAEHCFDKVSVTDEFLDKLSLSKDGREDVSESAKGEQQVKTLLDIVSRQPDSAFTRLLNALDDTQQTEPASYLRSFEEDRVAEISELSSAKKQTYERTGYATVYPLLPNVYRLGLHRLRTEKHERERHPQTVQRVIELEAELKQAKCENVKLSDTNRNLKQSLDQEMEYSKALKRKIAELENVPNVPGQSRSETEDSVAVVKLQKQLGHERELLSRTKEEFDWDVSTLVSRFCCFVVD